MGSKQVLSSGPDWTELQAALKHYEELLEVRIEIGISRTQVPGRSDLTLVAGAYRAVDYSLEAKPLASASASCNHLGVLNLTSAILLLLHDLDADLFRRATGIQPIPK